MKHYCSNCSKHFETKDIFVITPNGNLVSGNTHLYDNEITDVLISLEDSKAVCGICEGELITLSNLD